MALKINEVYSTTPPNLSILHTFLPPYILDEIINHKLHCNSNTEATFIWHEKSNEIYTTKASFSWLLKQRGWDATSTSWAWIWHLCLPEKIKFLVWLAHNNYIHTLSLLNHLNLAPNVLFPRCSSYEKSFHHCIRDCTTFTHLRHAWGFTFVEFFSNTYAICWLKQWLTSYNFPISLPQECGGLGEIGTLFVSLIFTSLPNFFPWKLVTYLPP